MSLLPCQDRFADGQIACRSLRSLATGERVILAIPGGPGLGGRYLERFLATLAEAAAMNVALLDLPNHGESVLRDNGAPLDYQRCVHLLESAVGEMADRTGGLALFGQSLGARLAFDLVALLEGRIFAAVLAGFPYKFENSRELARRLAAVSLENLTGGADDEAVFARNWRKILPFYTPTPLPSEVFEQLAAGTEWRGNERMLEAPPRLDAVAARLADRADVPLLVIQGGQDIVVPEGNLEALRRILPRAEFTEVPDAGHFVMVEKPSLTIGIVAEFLGKAGGGR